MNAPGSARSATLAVSLRMRCDLAITPQFQGGVRHWVVEDPLTRRYFHLRDEEYAVLRMLDGSATGEEIRQRFERRFAPLRLTAARLQVFTARLHQYGLVVSSAAGQGQLLQARWDQQRRSAWLQRLTNPLAIRLPGVDPQPFLRWLHPRLRWVFSAWSLLAAASLVTIALGLVTVEFGMFQQRLPGPAELFTARTVAGLAAALMIAKLLHELGHALTCQHFGGRCHEMGVMLLVFVPCLYCDVTDAWRFESKWARMAVSAAGMGVELVLAAACTLLWWTSAPGTFHTLCLHLMFVCSVSTILFNANPLLRYDGYYLVADLFEVPNLWQRSRELLGRLAARAALGLTLPGRPRMPERFGVPLLLYAALSICYRLAIVAALVGMAIVFLQRRGLEAAGWGLAGVVAFGVVWEPARSLWQLLSRPAVRREIRPGRALFSLVALLAALVGFALLPLPRWLTVPARLEPRDAQHVYATVPGRLREVVEAGARVNPGDVLARLENPEVERDAAELASRCRREKLRLEHLNLRRGDDPAAAWPIPATEKSLEVLEQLHEQRVRDQQALTLRAAVSGTVMPAPPWFPSDEGRSLAGWQGSPLEQHNLGCYLEAGSQLCRVGEPDRLEGMLSIEQSLLGSVCPGQEVRIFVDQLPGMALRGSILEIARSPVEDPVAASSRAPAASASAAGPAPGRGVETCYLARVQLSDSPGRVLPGASGRARIAVSPQSLGQRFVRFLLRTFAFP